jgi:chemotaxis protein MotB
MSNPAPIIVKRVIKKVDGHHGGSWKVAFADFATAMMAFFLLLWIMNNTTPEQKGAISEYFSNPSPTIGESLAPSPSPLVGDGGSSPTILELGAPVSATTPDPEDASRFEDKLSSQDQMGQGLDKARLESLLETLREATERSQALKPFKDQLLLDITPQGLRIQIIDKENRPMFGSGSAALKDYTIAILQEITQVINAVPNKISITGHTDAYQFLKRENYTNWELSTDRANAARRALADSGLAVGKVQQVVGGGDSVLFVPEDPYSPVNRRISIVVLTEEAARTLEQRSRQPVSLEALRPLDKNGDLVGLVSLDN